MDVRSFLYDADYLADRLFEASGGLITAEEKAGPERMEALLKQARISEIDLDAILEACLWRNLDWRQDEGRPSLNL